MTVAELVQLLADYPPDLLVVVNGYEEGYDDLAPGTWNSILKQSGLKGEFNS